MSKYVLGIFMVVVAVSSACTTLKPYEKEYLLDPTMDDAKIGRLTSSVESLLQGQNERLGLGLSLGGSTACPTCGG